MQCDLIINGLYNDVEQAIATYVRRFIPLGYAFAVNRDSQNDAILNGLQGHPRWHVHFHCDDTNLACIAGHAPANEIDLIQSLVRCSLSHFICEQKLNDVEAITENYAIQVTNDFEELVWLRSLAEQFTYCDVRNNMREVARQLLPSLRIVLNADCLYYVGHNSSGGPFRRDQILSNGETRSSTNIGDLIRFASGDSCDYVHIYNSTNSVVFRDQFPILHGCLLCRLGVGEDFFGWLIAIRYPIDNCEMFSGIDEREFGTFEGGLIRSAATLFQTHGRNIDLVQQKENVLVGAVRSLINSIDAKDPYTFGHSDRVAGISKRIALELGLDTETCEQIYMTGLLHDIGKIGIPDVILSKPSRLTDEEFAIIQQHPVIGYRILKNLDSLSYTFGGVLHHHESYDGSGYPDKLAGESIPLYGRILAVADSFDAMTSSRPYRRAMSFGKAESIVREGAGKQWDPAVVDAFFAGINDIRILCEAKSSPMKEHNGTSVTFDAAALPIPALAKL
jgi:HD-GYP domain-containing protein (c-di-GMP phosphodiesterase class II)